MAWAAHGGGGGAYYFTIAIVSSVFTLLTACSSFTFSLAQALFVTFFYRRR